MKKASPDKRINRSKAKAVGSADDLKKLGERLKFYRKKAGYTSYEYFAYEHGFSRPQYGKYEAGANITFATLSKILKALGISFEEFFKEF
jgi:transcriptional regulator with XRE-family HTH domain